MDPYRVLQISPAASAQEIREAYRTLARRWHPDRFAEGPERDWANEKMAAINAAYQKCRSGEALKKNTDDTAELAGISSMIAKGALSEARRSLMQLSGRSAEWNYLLGLIFLKTDNPEKARIYLSIAAHQKPEVRRYSEALQKAKQAAPSFLNSLRKRFSR